MRKKIKEERRWAAVLVIFYLLSLLPIVISGMYDYAQADDYAYGQLTHPAWVQSGSVWAVLRAAAATVCQYYKDWQGTYSSIFLMSLQPGIWGDELYHVVPFLFAAGFSAAFFLLFYAAFVRWLGARPAYAVSAAALVAFYAMQNVPDYVQAFYWYNGAVHYMGSMIALLFLAAAFLWGMKNEAREESTRKVMIRDFSGRQTETGRAKRRSAVFAGVGEQALLVLLALYVGGGNYVTVLQGLLLAATAVALPLLFHNSLWKRVLLPSAAMAVGAAVNMTAPGNAVRQALLGEPYNVMWTIGHSFESALLYIGRWTTPEFLLLLLVLLPLLYRMMRQGLGIRQAGGRPPFRFSLPGLVWLYSYCLLAAMFAPTLYTGGSPHVRRALNLVFLTFVLLTLVCLCYTFGWIIRRQSRLARLLERAFAPEARPVTFAVRTQETGRAADTGAATADAAHGGVSAAGRFSRLYLPVTGAALLLCVAATALTIPTQYTSEAAIVYMVNGEAGAWAAQIRENLDRLEDPQTADVVLTPVTATPRIYCADEIEDWYQGTRRYYGKNSVTVPEAGVVEMDKVR